MVKCFLRNRINAAIFLFIGLIVFSGCKKNKEDNNCETSSSLYNDSNYPIGVAVDFAQLNSNADYVQIVKEQFNSITPENIFKASYLHPERDQFYWDEADALTSFCQINNKRLHGHTLIWHNQLPQWIKNFEGGKEELENLFKEHIQTIVKHFKGKVAAWDVVNEAFNEDGTLRNSIWLQKLGSTYIEKAFVYAREADADVLLFYNDFNLEFNPTKLNSVIGYFNAIRNRGVKIDGIGIQMHISIQYPEVSQIAEAIKKVYTNGYKIHLSELDISVNPQGKQISASTTLFNQQADLLKKIVLVYNEVPEKHRYGISFWGVSDANSWIRSFYNRNDFPLLFDDNYQPKSAYCKFKEAL